MRKLLLTCDQVFEVLTRGPFPTGDESDEHVEHHLRACHDCRQLAEALRPAVELFHEVVSEDQALDLPEYQGSLPDRGPRVQRLSVVRLAKEQPKCEPVVEKLVPPERPQSSMRWVAALLLLLGLTAWVTGLIAESKSGRFTAWWDRSAGAQGPAIEGLPTEAGLLSLASLKLPAACLPLTHRPLSTEHAAQLALELMDGSLDKLRCCTECHHAGAAKSPQPASITKVALQNCQTCHRG